MPSEEEFAVTVAQLQALASAALSKPPSLAPTTSTSRFAHLTKTSSSPRSLSALCVHIDCIHSLCESHVIRDYDWSATGLYHALFTCLALLCSDVFVAAEVCDVELQMWRIWSYMVSHTLEWHPEAARSAAWHSFFTVKGGNQASNNTDPRGREEKQRGEQEQAMDVDSARAASEDEEDAQEQEQKEEEEEEDQFSFEPPASMPPPIRRRVDGHSGSNSNMSSSSSSSLAGDHSANAVVESLLSRLIALCTRDPKNVYGAALFGKPAECVQAAQHLFHWLYSVFAEHRPGMRRVLCRSIGSSVLKSNANHAKASPGVPRISAVDAGSSRLHVAPLLQLLLAIVTGLRRDKNKIAAQVMTCLLVDVLLPLHLPNEMLDWRDQKPAISSYHSVLVQCMLSAIDAGSTAYGSCSHSSHSSLAVTAIDGLLSQWPAGFHANSKKEVLLLHELEALVCACHVDEQAIVAEAVFRRVSLYMSNQNDNIFTTQRSLQMFKRAEFLNFLERNLAVAYDILIPAMYVPESGSCSSTRMSWNPTVNRMTGLALQAFRAQDSERFDLACDRLLTHEIEQQRDLSQNTNKESESVRISNDMPFTRGREAGSKRGRGVAVAPIPGNAAVTSAASVNAAVKAHAIPPRIPLPFPQRQTVPRSNGQGFNPASKMPAPLPMSTVMSSQNRAGGNRVGGMPRPMTRAPWVTAAAPADSASSAVARTYSMDVDKDHKEVTTKTNVHHTEVSKTQQEQAHSGRALMQAYIARCIPASSSTSTAEGKDAVADWNVVQASSTPTLLPNLKFHELVFHVGKPLGTGAFSVVKYARHVTPKCSQSDWPEYAVKTISHSVLTSFHYHSSVEREMSILRVLSHPGVCRGISFFRYSSAAYIVLEYCSRGDLHSYIIRRSRYVARNAAKNRAGGINGEDDANNELCVSTELARFIVGEITAALLYVHSLGLAYNDLKPENILITKLGHIKISDFGACRAVSEEGRDLLRSDSASAGGLGGLRSGGWWEDEGKSSAVSNFGATRAEQENTLWAQFPPPSHTPSETAPSADDFTNSGTDTIDNRAEGTPAYLPPEVLQNEISGIPGIASDVWALGCLLLFLLTGRPPFCGDRAAVLEQHLQAGMSSVDELNTNTNTNIDTECKAVSFKLPQQFALSVHNHASANSTHTAVDAQSAPGAIQSLLNGLLRINPQNRFKMSDVVQHEWLVGTAAGEGENGGMDPVNLHKSVPPVWPGPWPNLIGVSSSKGMDGMGADQGEDAGEVGDGEAEDPWARRQYSVLWYAMPSPVEAHAASPAGTSDGSSSKHGGCVPYSLIAVPETDVEHNSPFFVKL